jgi:NADH:ubiquinone oxidoreductase subunit 2 (subunit N)
MVMALAVTVYGVLRVMVILFQEADSEQVVREPNWQRFMVAIILLFAIFLALFPQPFLAYITQLAGSINGSG